MSVKINKDNYDKFVNMLTSFYDNNFNSTESIRRYIFITNIMNSINDLNFDDEDVVTNFNDFVETITTYKISIKELFDIFDTSLVDATTLIDTTLNYIDNNNQLNNSNLYNIYITPVETTDCDYSILKLFKDIEYTKNERILSKITPNISYSYRKIDGSIINKLSADKIFYNTAAIQTAINTSYTFTYNDFYLLYNLIKESYSNKMCILYDDSYDNNYTGLLRDILSFISKDTFVGLFKNNVYVDDVKILIEKLTSDFYKLYTKEVNKYENRNLVFNADEYISSLTTIIDKSLDYDDSKFILLKTIIKGDDNDDLETYYSELNNLKTYLNNIYSVAKSNGFILEV